MRVLKLLKVDTTIVGNRMPQLRSVVTDAVVHVIKR